MYLGVPHPNDSALVTGDDTAFINIVDIDGMGKKGKSVSTVGWCGDASDREEEY